MNPNLLAVQASTYFRNVIEAAIDLTPLLTGQALDVVSLCVSCSPVKTLDKVCNEFAVESVSEARLSVNQGFDILV
jgi:hypothetical protein